MACCLRLPGAFSGAGTGKRQGLSGRGLRPEHHAGRSFPSPSTAACRTGRRRWSTTRCTPAAWCSMTAPPKSPLPSAIAASSPARSPTRPSCSSRRRPAFHPKESSSPPRTRTPRRPPRAVFQSEPDRTYLKYLIAKIAAGVSKANQRLEPARIGWGVGKDPTQVFNRRWKVKPGSAAAAGPVRQGHRQGPHESRLRSSRPARTGRADRSGRVVRVGAVRQGPADGVPGQLFAPLRRRRAGTVRRLFCHVCRAHEDAAGRRRAASSASCPTAPAATSTTSTSARPGPASRRSANRPASSLSSVAQAAFEAYKNIKHHDWVPLKMAQKEIELGVRLPTAEEVKTARGDPGRGQGAGAEDAEGDLCPRDGAAWPNIPAKVKVDPAGDPHRRAGHRRPTRARHSWRSAWRSRRRARCGRLSPSSWPTATTAICRPRSNTPLGGYETWRARSSYLEVNASVIVTATLLELLNEVAR